MQKMTPAQLRAARALLNWSRSDLSKLSGVSEPTIHRFENAINEPESRTAKKLFEVFESHSVEFTDNHGVRLKPNNIDIYDGRERFDAFYEFLYEHLNEHGGDVCLSIYEDSLLPSLRKDPELHKKRMKKLHDQRKITFRILTTISDFGSRYNYASYRWLPDQPASPTGFYAFGDCLALMSFVDRNSPHIVVIHSLPLAEGYRQGFNVAWPLGKEPPKGSRKESGGG